VRQGSNQEETKNEHKLDAIDPEVLDRIGHLPAQRWMSSEGPEELKGNQVVHGNA